MQKHILAMAIVFLMSWAPLYAGVYSGGNGSPDTPFIINSPADWQELTLTSADWSANFLLTADIDLAGMTLSPVGISPRFKGTFDGQNHKIKNLTFVPAQSLTYSGAFGYAENAVLKNLIIENINNYTYGAYAGALVGRQKYGSIINCHSSGTVETGTHDTTYVGGIVGYLQEATISNSSSDCDVTASYYAYSYAGGLVGYSQYNTISLCASTGSVYASTFYDDAYAGGLVGLMYGQQIEFSYASGTVSAEATAFDGCAYAGGLVGYQQNDGYISACYSSGEVNAQVSPSSDAAYAGGLIAFVSGIGVYNSYATGAVNAYGLSTATVVYAGGLAGYISDNYRIQKCYCTGVTSAYGPYVYMGAFAGYSITLSTPHGGNFWDFEACDSNYNPNSTDAASRNTAEMKSMWNFLNAGWSFDNSFGGPYYQWRMCVDGADYPRLVWEYIRFGDFSCPNGVNTEDLDWLAGTWLDASSYTDLNGDGVTNLADFLILADHWLAGI